MLLALWECPLAHKLLWWPCLLWKGTNVITVHPEGSIIVSTTTFHPEPHANVMWCRGKVREWRVFLRSILWELWISVQADGLKRSLLCCYVVQLEKASTNKIATSRSVHQISGSLCMYLYSITYCRSKSCPLGIESQTPKCANQWYTWSRQYHISKAEVSWPVWIPFPDTSLCRHGAGTRWHWNVPP